MRFFQTTKTTRFKTRPITEVTIEDSIEVTTDEITVETTVVSFKGNTKAIIPDNNQNKRQNWRVGRGPWNSEYRLQ